MFKIKKKHNYTYQTNQITFRIEQNRIDTDLSGGDI